jgi:predicted nucleic acid-binding protein
VTASAGLLDTSVLIATERGRVLRTDALPDEWSISVVTLGELQAGVLAAQSADSRARRLKTLAAVGGLEALPVDAAAALEWARLRVVLAEAGRSMPLNDLWIAAVGISNGLPVVTQDADFTVLDDLGELEVILV